MSGQKRENMRQRMSEANERAGKGGSAMTSPSRSVRRLVPLFAAVWKNARVVLSHADRLLTTSPMCVLLTTYSRRRASIRIRCGCASRPQGASGVSPQARHDESSSK